MIRQLLGRWRRDSQVEWEMIYVEPIEDKAPSGRFPWMWKRVGKSPPEYTEEDE